MAVVLWGFALLVGFLAVMALSVRVRKFVLIWGTYLTLTGWYYYRVLEKKHRPVDSAEGSGKSRPGKAKSTSSRASSSTSSSSPKHDPDVVYFETPEEIQRRRETQRASELSSRLSDASSSGHSSASDDTLGKLQHQPKTHLGIFRSRKVADDKRRSASEADAMLSASRASESSSTSRRTFTGRYKKPAGWGD